MQLILAGLIFEIVRVYLYNIIRFRRSFEEHLEWFKRVFQRLAENGLKVKGSNLSQKHDNFVAHIISEGKADVN